MRNGGKRCWEEGRRLRTWWWIVRRRIRWKVKETRDNEFYCANAEMVDTTGDNGICNTRFRDMKWRNDPILRVSFIFVR